MFLSFVTNIEIYLKPCPFCGGDAEGQHIGNDHTKKRTIIIKCPTCQIERTVSTLHHDFKWLENVAAKSWNQRAESDSHEKANTM